MATAWTQKFSKILASVYFQGKCLGRNLERDCQVAATMGLRAQTLGIKERGVMIGGLGKALNHQSGTYELASGACPLLTCLGCDSMSERIYMCGLFIC